MNLLDRIALILVIIGSLNWGSIGIFEYDYYFGGDSRWSHSDW